MPTPQTVGQYLLQETLPPGIWNGEPIDKKVQSKMFTALAEKHKDAYVDILHKYNEHARDAVTRYGNEASIGLDDFTIPPAVLKYREKMRADVAKISQNPKLTGQQKSDQIVGLLRDKMKEVQDLTTTESLNQGSGLALSAAKGFRGNPLQLTQLLFGDMLLADHKGRPIPVPGLHGYGEGVRPEEYWAGAYGSRTGFFSVQFNTAHAGFLAKEMKYAAQRQIVTGDDCGATNLGLKVDGNNPENIGYVLAKTVNGIPAGTVIGKDHLPALEGKSIRVRSLATCKQPDGICKKCAGARDQGQFPAMGSYVGLNAASTIGEPLSQQLSLCLAEDTLVRMADWTVKKIQDITEGDTVIGCDEEGKGVPVKVLATHDNGLKDCVNYIFNAKQSQGSRMTLCCTADHKVLHKRQLGTFPNLYNRSGIYPIGDKKGRVEALSFKGTEPVERKSEPMALLAGLVLGDGCYTESVNSVNFSCADPLLLSDTEEYLTGLNLKWHKLKGHKYYYKISLLNEPSHERNSETGTWKAGYVNPIRRWLSDRGMLNKYAHEKTLPPDIDTWDNASVANLLAGLYATDGSIFKGSSKSSPHISLSMTSKELVYKVRHLLEWRFGIRCKSTIYESKPRQRNRRIMYSLLISSYAGVKKFIQTIPLVGIKRIKAEAWLREDALPKPSKHGFYADGYTLRKIENAGQKHTYDITVDHPSHLFLLENGIIVSNSVKHTGGVAGKAKKITGLHEVMQYFNLPERFVGAAAVAPVDGTVTNVMKAPQGGYYTFVGDKKVYSDADTPPIVTKGQTVEAGDVLTEGTAHPSDIVRYKGIGAGRDYWARKFGEVLDDNGVHGHKRHVESLARAMFDRVRITNPEGYNGYAPDELVPYSVLSRDYLPRQGSQIQAPKKAINQYLEEPVLHYTIGTRVTPSVIKDLDEEGVTEIKTHKDTPVFEPEAVRVMDIPSTDPDWKVRLAGFGLRKSLLRSATTGAESDTAGTAYVPKLMEPTKI